MSISADYFRYLDHFGPVTTLREMAGDPARENVIALRHDVDHDLDVALEMSYWEHRREQHATYFVLDTAPYWHAADFLDKCRQLAEFGHEVGVHLNSLCKWVRGAVNDVQQDLEASLERLRSVGIVIDSISTHGDRLCYERQFINYWCFQDLRPADPAARENGLSAEGIAVSDSRFQIGYPASHALKREDGTEFPLWSIPMSSVRLRYEAMHVPYDRYFTDSGGGWSRTPDPIAHDLTRGRNQILIHPEHWRGLQKLYFFLSTPRSGSKWLSEFLDRATPLRGTHEFTLNHRYQDGHVREDKLTLEHTNDLIANPALVRNLMLESRAWIEESPRDYAEANVYLGHFIGTLDQVFPDATLVHLHRDPKDVIRSLINRDWYDTPEDDRHPSIPVDGWSQMSQFAKACWYVRTVNESLIARCSRRIRFEEMVFEPAVFIADLEALGIPVYPLLAAPLFGYPINISYKTEFPGYEAWEDALKASFHKICGELCRYLRYKDVADAYTGRFKEQASRLNATALTHRDPSVMQETSQKLLEINCFYPGLVGFISVLGRKAARKVGAWWGWSENGNPAGLDRRMAGLWPGALRKTLWKTGCDVEIIQNALKVCTLPRVHCCLVLGGGSWYQISQKQGWKVSIGCWYRGQIEIDLTEQRKVTLFCLMYEGVGRLQEKRSLVSVSAENSKRRFSFKPRSSAARFALALYSPAAEYPWEFKLRRIVLEEITPCVSWPTGGP